MSEKQPEWMTNRKVFWDESGNEHVAPLWPPGSPQPRVRVAVAPEGQNPFAEATAPKIHTTSQQGVPALPKELLLYYVDDPTHGERWVPMSPIVVKALTDLAAQHGMSLDWREMDSTVTSDKAMKRS